MSIRSQRLPSLNGLKVFWAAARHGSFAKAADELHVTPSAVSLQVRQLEDELGEMLFPICSPDLLAAKDAAVSTAEFLASATLLHDDSTDQSEAFPGWKMWLRAAGIDGVDWRKGPHFDQSALAIEAAASGLGVALAPAVLVESDLASGRLVRLDSAELSEPFSY